MNASTLQRYAADPSAFRNDLNVDVDGNICQLGDVIDDWQAADFAEIDPGLMRCNGRSDDQDATMRIYLERGRGHSKTTDLAVLCCWAMAFATRPLRGYVFAADKDQASLLKDAMDRIIRLNPWLAKVLEVQKNQVLNIGKTAGSGSTLEIFTSDVGSSYGILADFIICDELTHWASSTEGCDALWHSVISSAAKRSTCLLVVIANAGFCETWQWLVRETARTDDAWYFSRLDGPIASWITEERLAEQQRMLPHIAYARLWLNNWSTGGGDALTTEVINAAFLPELQPHTGKHEGWLYVAGVDLGLTRDCAAVVVLAVEDGGRAGKIRLAHHRLWQPIPGKKINLLDVERHILELEETYGLEFVGLDPWQAEHLAQTLEVDSGHQRRNWYRSYHMQPWCRDVPPTPSNLREQASLTIEFFNDHRIQLYDCEPLRHDLHKLRVEEKRYGVRLTSPRDGTGHGDTFSAFAIALQIAHEIAGKLSVVTSVFGDGDSPTDYFAQRLREYEEDRALTARRSTQLEDMQDSLRNGTFFINGQPLS